jgi:spermidine synthase
VAFFYLQDSDASIELVLGDARLSLERELQENGAQNYHLLVLDVFSSDSIPVYLLNRESFALYLDHLTSDGILAVHIIATLISSPLYGSLQIIFSSIVC